MLDRPSHILPIDIRKSAHTLLPHFSLFLNRTADLDAFVEYQKFILVEQYNFISPEMGTDPIDHFDDFQESFRAALNEYYFPIVKKPKKTRKEEHLRLNLGTMLSRVLKTCDIIDAVNNVKKSEKKTLILD